MDRTDAAEIEKLHEQQTKLHVIIEKLKAKIQNQNPLEPSCDATSIQSSTSNTTGRIPLPSAPIKSSTSKECGEKLPSLASVPKMRLSRNFLIRNALLARNRRLLRYGITISVHLATAKEKSLKYRCRKFSPLRWSQRYADPHEL
ncbi:hypothetical protein BOTCAL_0031g00130 [Botryotinia calthae]|uniref:Uncharacterized protein n=1 Tax=Botryotinia calthae TaxID=38488 RepID=A0A4Y8DD91_9HELO|nr:hypothetical protein BOTCAL_0031g00130 [Botryotinia calthae]